MSFFELAVYGALGAAGASFILGALVALFSKRITAISSLFFLSSLAIAYGLFHILILEPNWIQVRRVTIHDAELAQVVEGTKIIHISDIHLTQGLGFREKDLIRRVNKLKPDIIFISGDFIDYTHQVPAAIELLRSLKANVGIWGVPGNTDHIVMSGPELKNALAPGGIDILVNESRTIILPNNRVLQLLGVDDPKYGYDQFAKTLRGVPYTAPVIMLAHSPEIFPEAVRERVNLVLAGDTHGGQVAIDFLIQMSEYANRTQYMRGIFRDKLTTMYVNRGIGMKTLPVRLFCRPEITVYRVIA